MAKGFLDSLPSYVNKGIDQIFRVLPETKKLDYILKGRLSHFSQLQWMDNNLEGEDCVRRLRNAAIETVMRYSVPDSPFFNDERLFAIFCIVGKLSRTMGLKSVMEELHNRKQFYELAEFYVKWAEIFAKERDRNRFNQIWNRALKASAQPTSRINEAFKAMLYQYFESDEEMTVNLFRKPVASKDLPVVFGMASQETRAQDQIEFVPTPSELYYTTIKGRMQIANDQESIEELFAQAGNYMRDLNIASRPSSRLSVCKLSAISEERSGYGSSSSNNPSQNAESLVKLAQTSEDGASDDMPAPAVTAAPTTSETGTSNYLQAVFTECPQSTFHGTSFTEKFLSKAMRDFSSTVPVPPPRSVHHETEQTTVLQETLNESEVHLPPALKKTKFEVYVEEPAKNQETENEVIPFTVHADENGTTLVNKKKTDMEQAGENYRNLGECESRNSQLTSKKITQHEENIQINGKQEKCTNEKIRLSLPDRTDEETLAGMNKAAKTGAITSTPASNYAPPIEDPIEDSFCRPSSRAIDDLNLKNALNEAYGSAFSKRSSEYGVRFLLLLVLCKYLAAFNKLSQKVGVENIVGNKVAGLPGSSNLNEQLRRLSIARNDVEINKLAEEELESEIINPWDANLRRKIMTDRRFYSTNVHDFPLQKCDRLTPGGVVILGGERFNIESVIGEGGFAKVYKSKSEDDNNYAIKFELPPCKWEVYICETLRNRMPKIMLDGIMNVRDAYIFLNASAIVYEYHRHGNLLDMVNKLRAKKIECSGLLTAYLAWEIARIVEAVHDAQIIHGDIKPDNFMILHGLNENDTIEHILDKKCFTLKLIDWGRAIDMSSFPESTFRGKAGTDTFDCPEMQDGRPWTYQTDYFGYISTLHVIIHGKYMNIYRNHLGRYSSTSVMKRRWHQKELLEDIFDMCMNIIDCKSLPKWSTIIDGLENNIKYWIVEDRKVWKQAARELNAGIAP
ncbi:unnamed protein product [Thelazia callipaeda]|uniref:Protein kinase domain-containing protein n=1 Tax=Thelazia callipaeda TaxID=103827 RepID=A0A0N5D811_THECL|nr:unnamed protein product [Thelazia callipaeda]